MPSRKKIIYVHSKFHLDVFLKLVFWNFQKVWKKAFKKDSFSGKVPDILQNLLKLLNF